MATKYVWQPPYSTKRRSYVKGSWQERKCSDANTGTSKKCTYCGDPIRLRKMQNGKIIAFNASPGMTHSKHPCYDRLDGYSKKRDENTIDILDEYTPPAEK